MKKNYITPLCEDVNFGSENVMQDWLGIEQASGAGEYDAD